MLPRCGPPLPALRAFEFMAKWARAALVSRAPACRLSCCASLLSGSLPSKWQRRAARYCRRTAKWASCLALARLPGILVWVAKTDRAAGCCGLSRHRARPARLQPEQQTARRRSLCVDGAGLPCDCHCRSTRAAKNLPCRSRLGRCGCLEHRAPPSRASRETRHRECAASVGHAPLSQHAPEANAAKLVHTFFPDSLAAGSTLLSF